MGKGSSKPRGLSRDYALQFSDAAVVETYGARPPYPKEVFALLKMLAGETPRRVLDLGCGTGAVARGILDWVDHVDAVDLSPGLIAKGKRLPGGDDPRIRWIMGAAEEVQLDGNYSLVAAGSSLHWMDWDVVMPRIADWLRRDVGVLAIFNDGWEGLDWEREVNALVPVYSTNQEFERYDLIEELVSRGLLHVHCKRRVHGELFEQSAADYVEAFHGRNGFSRDRMELHRAREFDQRVKEIVERHCPDGVVRMRLVSNVVWGRPVK